MHPILRRLNRFPVRSTSRIHSCSRIREPVRCYFRRRRIRPTPARIDVRPCRRRSSRLRTNTPQGSFDTCNPASNIARSKTSCTNSNCYNRMHCSRSKACKAAVRRACKATRAPNRAGCPSRRRSSRPDIRSRTSACKNSLARTISNTCSRIPRAERIFPRISCIQTTYPDSRSCRLNRTPPLPTPITMPTNALRFS